VSSPEKKNARLHKKGTPKGPDFEKGQGKNRKKGRKDREHINDTSRRRVTRMCHPWRGKEGKKRSVGSLDGDARGGKKIDLNRWDGSKNG